MKTFFMLLLFVVTACTSHPALADAVIFSGSDVKTLKPNIDLFGQAKILSGNINPQSTATSAPIGSLYLNTVTGDIFKKVDAGSSTNWTKLGADQGAIASNYVKNSFATANVNDVTASGGSLTRNTTTPLFSTADFLIDASASGQTYKWDTFTFDKLLKGGNCEANLFYAGDGSLYKAYVEINSVKVSPDYQMANTASNSAYISMPFPCGDLTTATKVVIESTSASAAAINVVGVTAGKITSLSNISQATFYGGMEQVGAAGCNYSESTSTGLGNFVDLGSGSGCNAWTTEGAVTAVGTNSSQFTLANMPPGHYQIQMMSTLESSNGQNCFFRLSDGTNSYQPQQFEPTGASGIFAPTWAITVTSAASRTYKVQASDDGAGTCRALNSSVNQVLAWKVYKFPTDSQQALNPNNTPAFYNGYHDSTCSWSRTNTVYGDFTADASCALADRNKSNITATATGSVLPAIAVTLPKTGAYLVCAKTSVFGSVSTGHALRLWDGTTSISEGSDTSTSDSDEKQLCGIYNATTLNPTFTIQGQSASGSVTIQSQRAAPAVEWNIIDVSQNTPAPLLVGSVTSSSSGVDRIERANLTVDGSTCTITAQSGTWATSPTRPGTGQCNFTISPAFASVPTCICTADGSIGSAPDVCWLNGITASTVATVTRAGGANANGGAKVVCFGPK